MTDQRTLVVSGLCCEGCELNAERSLLALDGVRKVRADAVAGTVDVVVADSVPPADLTAAVREAGFAVE